MRIPLPDKNVCLTGFLINQGSKRALAKLEGHNDPKELKPWTQFFAAGMGGMISQLVIPLILVISKTYPFLDSVSTLSTP